MFEMRFPIGDYVIDSSVSELVVMFSSERAREMLDELLTLLNVDPDDAAREMHAENQDLAKALLTSLNARNRMDERLNACGKDADQARAERDAAREALRKYGKHVAGCQALHQPRNTMGAAVDPYPCTCGYQQALDGDS
jgi:hypothetical protein